MKRRHLGRRSEKINSLTESVNPKIVQEKLGHSSIVLTLGTYSHVLPTMQEDATAKLEMLLKSG